MTAPHVGKPRRQRQHHEHEAQAALFLWAGLATAQHPELRLLHAIPNWAGVKGPREGAMRKREGVKAGVPDLHLPVARGPYVGLWIEMKHGANPLSPEQKVWLQVLQDEGHRAVVCRSMESARAEIEQYLALPKR